jgi:hypothetical protein
MTFVENKRKELKTSYKTDTPEVGEEQNLLPTGLYDLKSNILKRNRTGIK